PPRPVKELEQPAKEPPPKEETPPVKLPPDKGKIEVPPPPAKEPVKEPPPKEEKPPVKPARKGEIPDDLLPIITRLKTGTDKEKVKAAEELALRGENAKPAARTLCEAVVSPSKEVSRSALQALEKVSSDVYDPVFTLVVDGQASNHLTAITALRGKGSE